MSPRVAAGGDGTAGAVANVLAGTCHVLGVLPLGTSNNFARSLGIPVDPRRAAGLFAAARAMRGRRPFTCELQYPDASESRTLTQLSVINAPAFGGPLRLSVAASDPDDRLLDILTVDDVPPVRMLLAAVPVLLRGARPVRGVADGGTE